MYNNMNEIVDGIFKAVMEKYHVEIELVNGVIINIDTTLTYVAFDHETEILEIHSNSDTDCSEPIISIKQEDIVAWK